jgi:lysophospholipase L1-like esterase
MRPILIGSLLGLAIVLPHCETAQRMHRFHYLALGDSYTIGESVPAEGRFPQQLADLLRRNGVDLADPEIIARTGWTTDELSSAIDDAAPHGPYLLVTLLIGVNNQYRGRDVAQYRVEFRQLLDRSISFAGSADRVVVLSIPDWGVTPFAAREGRDRAQVEREIDAYNAAAQEETTARHAHWLDITPLSRTAATDASLLAADGLHPSEKMYQGWSEALLPIVQPLFRGKAHE